MFIFTIGDIIYLALLVIALSVGAIFYAVNAWQQWHCKHDSGVNETQSCDAICRSCGKNLGFIGTWRDQHTGDTP